MCLKVKVTSLSWCPTLCDPVDCSPPGSSVHGIFQARVLEWVAISFSKGSSQCRDWNWVSCIAGRCFTLWPCLHVLIGWVGRIFSQLIHLSNYHDVCFKYLTILFSYSVQSLICVWLFATPWPKAHQTDLSITNSWSLLKVMSIKSVMPSNHLILCPLLLPPPIFSSIRVFSSESGLHVRWLEYWSFSFSISPSNEHPGLISFKEWTRWISLQSNGLSRVFSNTTVQKHQFFCAQPSSQSNSHIHTWPLEKP